MTDREQAQTAVANLLLERIRLDKYPSATEMDMLEQVIPQALMRDYINVLLEKVLMDEHPSIPMLLRIRKVVSAF